MENTNTTEIAVKQVMIPERVTELELRKYKDGSEDTSSYTAHVSVKVLNKVIQLSCQTASDYDVLKFNQARYACTVVQHTDEQFLQDAGIELDTTKILAEYVPWVAAQKERVRKEQEQQYRVEFQKHPLRKLLLANEQVLLDNGFKVAFTTEDAYVKYRFGNRFDTGSIRTFAAISFGNETSLYIDNGVYFTYGYGSSKIRAKDFAQFVRKLAAHLLAKQNQLTAKQKALQENAAEYNRLVAWVTDNYAARYNTVAKPTVFNQYKVVGKEMMDLAVQVTLPNKLTFEFRWVKGESGTNLCIQVGGRWVPVDHGMLDTFATFTTAY